MAANATLGRIVQEYIIYIVWQVAYKIVCYAYFIL